MATTRTDLGEGQKVTCWPFSGNNDRGKTRPIISISSHFKLARLKGHCVGAVQDAPRADPDAERDDARPARRQDALR
jgi:hypothetical protein